MLKFIKTKDKSITLYNEEYKDFYHSRDGAIKESLYQFIYPIKNLLKNKDNFLFVELGFGLGYNALVFNYYLRKLNKNFKYYSIEKDKNLLDFLEKNCEKFKIKNYCNFLREFKNSIIIKDATKINYNEFKSGDTIKIFLHDGFTPSKNKEIWSFDFFKKINFFDIIITYTNNPKIRVSLFLNDYYVFPTRRFKNSGTIAVKELKFLDYLNIKKYNLREIIYLFSNLAKPYGLNINKKYPFKVKNNKISIKDKNFYLKIKELTKNQDIILIKNMIKSFYSI